jgi:hypothetical protein
MVRSISILMVALSGVAGAQGTPTPYTPGSNSTDNNNPPPQAVNAQEPTVRVTLNGSGVYDRGDRARVRVTVRDDGYIVALHATPDGHIVPLYPTDPRADDFVRGGSDVDLQSRGSDASFVVEAKSGNGTVYVAYSRDPFNFADFTRGGNWDFDAFPDSGVAGHGEAVMTDLVQHMATGQHFDYDLATYSVTRAFNRDRQQQQIAYDDAGPWDPYYTPVVVGYSPWWGPGYYGFAPYWYSPFIFGVGFGFDYGFGFGGGFGCCCCFGGGFHHHGFYGPGYRGGYVNRTSITTVTSVSGARANVFAAGRLGVGGNAYRSSARAGAFTNVSLRGSVASGNRSSTVFPHSVSGSPAGVPNSGRVVYSGSGSVSQGSRVSASRVPMPNGGGGVSGERGGFGATGSRSMASGGQFNGGGSRVEARRVAPREVGPSAGDAFGGGRGNVGGMRSFNGGGQRSFGGGTVRAGGGAGRMGGYSGGRQSGGGGHVSGGGGGGGHGGGGGGHH